MVTSIKGRGELGIEIESHTPRIKAQGGGVLLT